MATFHSIVTNVWTIITTLYSALVLLKRVPGIFTSDGDDWYWQRKLVLSIFHTARWAGRQLSVLLAPLQQLVRTALPCEQQRTSAGVSLCMSS